MIGELRQFRRRRLTPEEGKRAAERILAMPIPSRREDLKGLALDDPETLLPLLESLRHDLDCAPATTLEEAIFLFAFLEPLDTTYPASAFLLDEKEYFLGETARIAGTACRQLTRRDEARRWFDIAEVWFLRTENSAGNLAKLTYQRLALRTEIGR